MQIEMNKVKAEIIHNFWAVIGVSLYAVAFRWFIVPLGLYSGGVTGISQMLLYFMRTCLGFTAFENIDLTGILYWIINAPMLLFSMKSLGKKFFFRTLLAISAQSFVIAFLPRPAQPVLSDPLLNCLIGGGLAGLGIGLALRSGSSCGGTDILGMYITKKHRDFGVGRINLIINVIIFAVSALLFSLDIGAYSTVYALISGFVTDRVHDQTIKISVLIVSEKEHIGKILNSQLRRGVTSWRGKGEYTDGEKWIYMTVISKYELGRIISILRENDPHAFVQISSPRRIIGNFEQRLDA